MKKILLLIALIAVGAFIFLAMTDEETRPAPEEKRQAGAPFSRGPSTPPQVEAPAKAPK